MRILIALLITLSLCGCYTEQKATRQVYKAHSRFPEIPAKFCADTYPPTDSVWEREVIIPGETEWRYDTVTVDCDSVRTTGNGTRIVRIPCPPCPVRVDTIVKEKHVTEVNKARETELAEKLRKEQIEHAKTTQGRNTWRMIGIILIAGAVLGAVITLLKKHIWP